MHYGTTGLYCVVYFHGFYSLTHRKLKNCGSTVVYSQEKWGGGEGELSTPSVPVFVPDSASASNPQYTHPPPYPLSLRC